MAVLYIISDRLGPDKVARGRIKNPIEPHQSVGDVCNIYDTPHTPTSTAIRVFDFIEVEGMTKAECIEAMPYVDRDIVEDNQGDEYGIWKEKDETKWKKLKNRKKFELSIVDLIEADIIVLKDPLSTKNQKKDKLKKLKNKIEDDPGNQDEDEDEQ